MCAGCAGVQTGAERASERASEWRGGRREEGREGGREEGREGGREGEKKGGRERDLLIVGEDGDVIASLIGGLLIEDIELDMSTRSVAACAKLAIACHAKCNDLCSINTARRLHRRLPLRLCLRGIRPQTALVFDALVKPGLA